MSTMYRRNQYRSNPHWLKILFRRIGICRFYRSLKYSWRDSWEKAGRTL